MAGGAATSSGIASAQSATYTCTEVIGFSQTEQWYDGGFISSIGNPGNWQLRWFSGGSIDQWASGGGNYQAGGFAGWDSQYLVTHCAQNSNSPDRVVLQVSGQFNSDPNWWANQTEQAIANIRSYAPHERSISLVPVVGGPNGGPCYDSSGNIVRATYNFPYINQGLAMDVGSEVTLGPQPTVDSCADYADNVGHLQPNARQYVGARIAQFYASGATTQSATSTPTPTAASVSAPTATPTPAASASGTTRITFDDLSSPNRALNGQYPTGLIDWGSNAWYLSGPYGQFTTQSISFNGASATSASFTFVNPKRPVQVDAYNGGTSSSLVTLSCNGTLINEVSLPSHQMTTLPSGMTGTCSTVTLGSGNGWNTNFDNLVVDNGAASAPTNTPQPTATPTRAPATSTPTAVPTAGGAGTQSVVGFDDLSNPNRPLTGQYGGMDWGSGGWWLSGPYAQFTSNSVSFNGASLTSASINMPTPMRVIQVDADNGGASSTTVSLSCPGQTTVQASVPAGQIVTIRTAWSGTCSSLSVSSSNGWSTNFDNFTVNGGSSTPPTSTPTATPTPITVNFDDLTPPNRALNGQYPSGVIDWGTGAWYLSGAYGGDTTNSASFASGVTSASFTLVTPRKLASIDFVNGGTTNSTVTLSCAGQSTVSAAVAQNQRVTLNTNWTGTCSSVTVTSSNGWYTNIDNLVLR